MTTRDLPRRQMSLPILGDLNAGQPRASGQPTVVPTEAVSVASSAVSGTPPAPASSRDQSIYRSISENYFQRRR